MTEAAVDRWHWTLESYEQAAATGVFGPEPRVELIDGEVYKVAPMLPGHASVVSQVADLLAARLDQVRWVIRWQMPICLDDYSQPEPDVCVAGAPRERYRDRHPMADDLALVVEVADTSLAFDRKVKVPLYARAAIPEVWVVSLPEQVVHRYSGPDMGAGEYRVTDAIEAPAHVPAHTLGIEIPVADILALGQPPQLEATSIIGR